MVVLFTTMLVNLILQVQSLKTTQQIMVEQLLIVDHKALFQIVYLKITMQIQHMVELFTTEEIIPVL